jgi:glycosyltransferase involved in cell wall biosynthesis
VLHQIGNNPGHTFVLRALRRIPGVVTLHDLNLFYLYERSAARLEEILALMEATSPALARVFGGQIKHQGAKAQSVYHLFDMTAEVLRHAEAVIVHSAFARTRIAALHGEAAAAKLHVVPHFMAPAPMPAKEQARRALGVSPDEMLVVTAGFATHAKRFDWTIAALEAAVARRVNLRWLHAGEERAEEFPLSARLAEHPALAARTRVAGFVTDADLNAHLAAADVVVNLRWPSVGESSGTLSRAMAAGACCLVSDTAAYAELPRDAVLHVPVLDPARHLAALVEALWVRPDLRQKIGAAGAAFARREWALPGVAARYREILDELALRAEFALLDPKPKPPPPRPVATDPLVMELTPEAGRDAIAAALAGRRGAQRLELRLQDAAALAEASLARPGLLNELLPESVELRHLRLAATGADDLRLVLELQLP